MEERSRVTEATNDDWIDFWYYEDQMISDVVVSDFERVWREMDQIEPLTPITQSQRKD